MGSVSDDTLSSLAGSGFLVGSLRDRQMAKLVSGGFNTGSYADRSRVAGTGKFPESPYVPVGGPVVGMPALVQTKTAFTNAAAQIQATFDTPPIVGNVIVVILGSPTANLGQTQVVEQPGFTYLADRYGAASTGYWGAYYKKAAAGAPSTYSFTSTTATNSHIIIAEYSGMPVPAADQIVTGDTAGAASLSLTLGPTAAAGATVNELVLMPIVSLIAVTTPSNSAGWAMVGPGTNRLSLFHRVNTSRTTETNTYSQGTSTRLSGGIICLKPGSS